MPQGPPPYLYDLVASYPRRGGKCLRAALCLATCRALGGSTRTALETAAAIELLHNAFLIHDDVQDGSEQRRSQPTLHQLYGVSIALNVGHATNLIALEQVAAQRVSQGPHLAWLLGCETHEMLRHTLEGQALELAWIHDNAMNVRPRDYYRMCLKKTSWYTCIYPFHVGALLARHPIRRHPSLTRFGAYLGAAFQVQDDVLNLTGHFSRYGKEINGDLWEGKRTLMLIRLLHLSRGSVRGRLRRFLATPRRSRTDADVRWVLSQFGRHGCVEHARRQARRLAGAALVEGLSALRDVPDSPEKRFLLTTPLYVVERDH